MPNCTPIFALNFVVCLSSALGLAGCVSSPATRPELQTRSIVQPRNDIDAFAYDRPTGSVSLPAPGETSRAVPTTVMGDGRMVASASPSELPRDNKATVVLNLSSVPLQQAAKIVLADLIGVNYVVDPRVDGNVTVQTVKPVTKADALEIFQSALAPIGATISVSRGIYRIGPADPIQHRRGVGCRPA